ncbi:MAG: hypothetical protein WD077_05530 [Bacteroidia bacterium]
MNKLSKYILGLALTLIGVVTIAKTSFLGGLLIIITGLSLIPPISDKLIERLSFLAKRPVRIAFKISLLILGLAVTGSTLDKQEPEINSTNLAQGSASEKSPYQNYLNEVEKRVASLPEEQKAWRNNKLTELKEMNTYKLLVDNETVSVDYIPVLNAISNGMTYISSEGFSVDEVIIKRLEQMTNGDELVRFSITVIGLAQPQRGGLTNEIIDVFVRYKNRYKYYGEPSVVFDADGKQTGKIEFNYDLSSLFGVIAPTNKEVLNAVYEARSKGLSVWNDEGDYTYNYIATKRGYNDYLKRIYPSSPYYIDADFELSATQLFKAYDDNEVAADDKYLDRKLMVHGVIEDIGKDIMGDPYVSLGVDYLQSVNCYFSDDNMNVISKLRKGQNLTVIGVCKGKTLNISVSLNDCIIWE